MRRFIAFLLKIGFGGVVDRGIQYLERRAELEHNAAALKEKTTAELARAAVRETHIMADLNKAKMSVPWFWLFSGTFLAVLMFWAGSVVIYSVFWCADCAYPKGWTIAALPEPLETTFAKAMEWLFYTGSGVGAVKILARK